jgi:glycerate dehydrogenase
MNNIDLHYAKEKNIDVKNVSGYSTQSVVQTTFMLALNLIMHARYYDDFVKNKGWQNAAIFTNVEKPFFELEGKTWGIIGLGEIGRNVAKIAQTFGCKIIYYSASGKNKNSDYEQVDLHTLLSRSDILSIHAPLNEQTLNLITQKELDLLKEGAVVLNLGRGGIINENDLAQAIDNDTKEIFVGLDVISKEPIEADNPLNTIKNIDRVQYTPHIAWASYESRIRLIQGIYNNIKEFIA